MNSWKANVDLAKKGVIAWDFKSKEQYTMMTKAQKKLTVSEAEYRAQCVEIDSEVENLRALYTFVENL